MDHVLIATGRTKHGDERVYHIPDEENPDVPECKDLRSSMTKKWVRKDLEMLPTHRECKDCTGQANRGGETGPELWAELSKMDPDDLVGGSA